MHSVKGSYKNGIVTMERDFPEREGQNVLITFLDNGSLAEVFQDDLPTIKEFVARLTVLGAEPEAYTPPAGSLAKLLANAPYETPIDSAAWDRQWALIETEMKERDLADDRAEGRD